MYACINPYKRRNILFCLVNRCTWSCAYCPKCIRQKYLHMCGWMFACSCIEVMKVRNVDKYASLQYSCIRKCVFGRLPSRTRFSAGDSYDNLAPKSYKWLPGSKWTRYWQNDNTQALLETLHCIWSNLVKYS
jgi:hypothetical protein